MTGRIRSGIRPAPRSSHTFHGSSQWLPAETLRIRADSPPVHADSGNENENRERFQRDRSFCHRPTAWHGVPASWQLDRTDPGCYQQWCNGGQVPLQARRLSGSGSFSSQWQYCRYSTVPSIRRLLKDPFPSYSDQHSEFVILRSSQNQSFGLAASSFLYSSILASSSGVKLSPSKCAAMMETGL